MTNLSDVQDSVRRHTIYRKLATQVVVYVVVSVVIHVAADLLINKIEKSVSN